MKTPDNGPTFSKAPPRKRPSVNTTMAPSPAKREAELDQAARDAARERKLSEAFTSGTALEHLGILPKKPEP